MIDAIDDDEKAAIVRAAVARLEADAAALRASAEATREGALHEESRAENDKDTRGLEASYLARGQAKRVEETEEAATRLRFLDRRAFGEDDPIDLAALVRVSIDEVEEVCFFLAPVGGGLRVEVGGVAVTLLTPASPVGRALAGKVRGDVVEVKTRGTIREYAILDVR